MSREGFHGTTTNHIAQAAGVSIGTVYQYFPSKEALVEAVVHRMWARELAVLEANGQLLVDAPLETAVRALVGTLVAVMFERLALYARWFEEAPHLGQLDLGLQMSDRATQVVRLALEQRNDVRPQNLAFASDLVVKTVLAVVRTASRDYVREVASGELAEELTQMIARYLSAKPL